MKVVLVGDRPVVSQRLAQLMAKQGLDVTEASLDDNVVELLANEPFDVMLLLAPEDELVARDVLMTVRDVRPSLHIYLLTSDGGLSTILPELQPALSRRLPVSDLPSALQEAVQRGESEREYLRLEWLKYVEDLEETVGTADTVREASQKVVDAMMNYLRAAGAVVILQQESAPDRATVVSSGDSEAMTRALKEGSSIYEWVMENQTPLFARRGRSAIPGVQRDMVKFGLGPTIFVPILTTQKMYGLLAVRRTTDDEPFSDSAFAIARIAAKTLALRIGGDLDTSIDELQQMLVTEREWRQTLEDSVGESQDMLRRLTREVANLIDRSTGYRASRSETIARLAVALAEQLGMDTEHLQEAVYLRDIGVLGMSELAPLALRNPDAMAQNVAAEMARHGFEILSRVRMPSVCIEVARHHRESYDGTGVPDGLKGEEIPRSARVVRVVEDYVNLTSLNNGEGTLSSPEAVSRMLRDASRRYDPDMVEPFSRMIRAQGVTPEQETLSVIAHELRTPLTFLVGFSELLAGRSDLPGQAKDMAAELHRQTEQMVVLTERLLELSRLQSGRVSLSYQWSDLKSLLEEGVTKTRALSDHHNFVVDTPSYPVRTRLDVTRLGQAIGNLLNNAVKYSPEGGNVYVSLKETPEEVTVSVGDEGVGIPKDKVGRLFEPFYRVQEVKTQQIEGLGLGLALTKAIVEAHGGRIWVESEPGQGSRFQFSIPKGDTGIESRRPY